MACSISCKEKIKLKVLFVTTAFPRWKDDGRGAFIYEMANAIRNAGCSIKVVAMHSPGVKEYEEIEGIEVFRPRYLPDKWEVLRRDSAGIPYAWKTYPFAKLEIIPFVIKHLIAVMKNKKEVDVIHAHWTLSAAVVMLSQFINSKPFVITVHGSDVFQGLQNPIFRFISRIVLMTAKFVITPSKALAEKIIDLGIEPNRVKIISNGINLSPIKTTKREPIILFVGSIVESKGVKDLFEAFLRISKINTLVELVFIGEGKEIVGLKLATQKSNVKNRIHFLGALPHSETIEWMGKSRILVLPSYQEGQGVVLLEAMSVGTPCIGSKVGGIPEIIDNKNGWLFTAGDINELSKILLEALNDEQLWKEKSDYCLEFIKKFSWDQIGRKLIDIYYQCIIR